MVNPGFRPGRWPDALHRTLLQQLKGRLTHRLGTGRTQTGYLSSLENAGCVGAGATAPKVLTTLGPSAGYRRVSNRKFADVHRRPPRGQIRPRTRADRCGPPRHVTHPSQLASSAYLRERPQFTQQLIVKRQYSALHEIVDLGHSAHQNMRHVALIDRVAEDRPAWA